MQEPALACRWRVGGCGEGRAPELATDMLGHADWVNDLALRPELLASCSSDRTVRLWRPEGAHADHSHKLVILDWIKALGSIARCVLGM